MNAPKKSRKSMRLENYDYSKTGAYFVSICTQNRICLFGQIIGGESILNDIGQMIQFQWENLRLRYPSVDIDEYIVMPNHIHGIISINDAEMAKEDIQLEILDAANGRPKKPSLGMIIGSFKSITTHEYINRVNEKLWAPFENRLWQRGFYDHIVRNSKELNSIREYIILNPSKWELDRDNPDSGHKK